jgi:DNA polymerase-1
VTYYSLLPPHYSLKIKKPKIVIIHGNALLHRAWHAIPDLKTKDGTMVNALYGWLMIFFKMYKDLKPEYIAVTFDLKGPTFRHEEYPEYKAQRKKQPDELYDQLPYLKEMIEIFNIPIYEKKGFEADDVIGTICDTKQVDRDDVVSIIVTGDLDTLQLVDNNTWVYTLKKGLSETVEYKEKQVKLKYGGLRPDQLIDYKALRGDPSDNIPGVPGIGEKTAIDLITKFKTLDNLYTELKKDPEILKKKGIKDRIINLLQENKKHAQLSKKLVTIKRDVKVEFDIEDCKVAAYDKDEAINFLQEFEFKSLVDKLPDLIVHVFYFLVIN